MGRKRDKRRRADARKQAPAPAALEESVVFFGEDGEALFTLAEHEAAQERASADDRSWFEQRPRARGRVRDFIPGELPVSSQACAHVLVRRVKPGVRMRQPLVPGWQPFTYLRVDPETGELLGKYSEAEAWQDAKYRELAALLRDMD